MTEEFDAFALRFADEFGCPVSTCRRTAGLRRDLSFDDVQMFRVSTWLDSQTGLPLPAQADADYLTLGDLHYWAGRRDAASDRSEVRPAC